VALRPLDPLLREEVRHVGAAGGEGSAVEEHQDREVLFGPTARCPDAEGQTVLADGACRPVEPAEVELEDLVAVDIGNVVGVLCPTTSIAFLY
jgi:hypothetical protein